LEDEARLATLDDMRRVMRFTIRSFDINAGNVPARAAALRRMNEPADELDPDLFPALA
jgi:hypothetical protein